MGQGPRWSLAGGRPPAVLDHGARYLLSPGRDSASLLRSSLVILQTKLVRLFFPLKNEFSGQTHIQS